jgi:hypothetical protein
MHVPLSLYKGHCVPSGQVIELASQLYEYKLTKFSLVDCPPYFLYPLLIPSLTSSSSHSRVMRPFGQLLTLGSTAPKVAGYAIAQSISLTKLLKSLCYVT